MTKGRLCEVRAREVGKTRFGEGFGQFDLALAAPAAKDDRIPVPDAAHRRTILRENDRFQGIIGLPFRIQSLDHAGKGDCTTRHAIRCHFHSTRLSGQARELTIPHFGNKSSNWRNL